MRIAILNDWFDTLRELPCYAKLQGHDVTVWNDHVQDTAVLAHRLAGIEALVLFRERTKIARELLGHLDGLKLISQRSVFPHIDGEACTDNGVLLCSNTHGGAPSYAAAELTWGLILAAMRQIPQQMAFLKAGDRQMCVGKTLRGRTLSLYGYGRIAKAVAGYGEAFGMNVLWWASKAGRERAASHGAALTHSREDFFARCDIISLHVRLKPDTQGIIAREDFAKMRPDALFVNTSRAGLVQPGALLDALNNGRRGSAAVDVFETEPLTDPADVFISHPNLICTPHIGYVTEDELDMQFSDIFDQINAFAAGEPFNMINPEGLAAK